MKNTAFLSVLALTFVACADPPPSEPDAAAPMSPPSPAQPAPSFAPDEAIVEVVTPLTLDAPVALGGHTVVPIAALAPSIYHVRIVDGARARVATDPAARTLDAIAALGTDGRVRSVAVNGLIEFSAVVNDPVFPFQEWHYGITGIAAAWDRTMGTPTARLALLDSGSTPHPDLVWTGGYSAAQQISDPLDLGTYHHGTLVGGVIGARANTIGGLGVCSGCAVIPVRVTTQASVAVGLNWLANVDGQTGAVLGARRADVVNMSFNYFVYRAPSPLAGQRVRCGHDQPEVVAIRTALARARLQGLFAVSAAGNGGDFNTPATDGPEFPGDCPDVFAAAAISRPDQGGPGFTRAWYSSHGPGIDAAAPGGGRNNAANNQAFFGDDIDPPFATPCRHLANDGVFTGTAGIVSTHAVPVAGAVLGQSPDDFCYRYVSGTSFAAPHVTGIAGLMLSARAGLSPLQLEWVLRLTAKPEGTDLGFNDPLSCDGCGAGLVDADQAVAAVQQAAPAIATATPADHDFGAVAVGGQASVTIAVGSVGFAPVVVSSGAPMSLFGPFSFAYASGACTSGQTCARSFSVPVGGSVGVPIRCAPTSVGAATGVLFIPSSSVGALRVTLRCTGVASPPVLTVPPTLAFGDVVVGGASDQAVTVTNTGGTPLTITGATVSGAAAITRVSGLPANIPGNGGTASITLRCAPTTAGALTATLALTSDGGNRSVAVTCNGVLPPVLTVPGSLSFGDVAVGTASDRALTITNTGGTPLTITGATLSGAAAITRIPGSLPGNIPGNGGTATIAFRCAPTAAGALTATLALTSNGGSRSVSITCNGVNPPRLVAPSSLTFGSVRVGTVRDLSLTVSNLGDQPLTITSAMVTGAAAITRPAGALPTDVPGGGTGTITLRCAPTTVGVLTATLALTSNGGTASVPLTCTGVAPAITSWPSWVEFSTVLRGTTASQYLSITNPGTAPLTITGATVTGTPFAIATPTPFTVAAGATTSVEVRCAPPAAAYYQGTITVTHDAGTAPLTVGTGCLGVLGRITLLEPTGGVTLQAGESATATIRNDGVGPLDVAELRFSNDVPGLSFSGAAVPATLAVGETLSWQVDCAPWQWDPVWAKVYAKHNGLQEGSLFAVTCGGGWFELPGDPIEPPIEER